MINLRKYNIKYLCLFLIFAWSGVFLANITIFSPVYFSFMGVVLLLLAYLLLSGKLFCDTKISIIIFFDILIIFYLFIQLLISHSIEYLKDYVIYALSVAYLPFVVIFSHGISMHELIIIIKKYMLISTTILILDIIWRFYNRDSAYLGILSFYNYKRNGIMFMDSNFSAFFAMINFSFALYLQKYQIVTFSKKFIFFQFILIVFNMSRAAIIAALLLVLYILFEKQKTAIKIVIFPILFLFIFTLVSFIILDPSFLTKIEIFHDTAKYLQFASGKSLIFGNGYMSSIAFLGRAAHNYISFLLIEMGFVSLFLFFLLFLCIYFITQRSFLYILIPYLIAGLSMAPTAIPYFYAIAGMMYVFQKKGYSYEKTK
jgi:hypothetical protein